MNTCIIRFNDNTGEEYFSVFVGSDGRFEDIEKLWFEFCGYSDLDTLEKKGRLNWSYLTFNFMRFISEGYKNKTSINCNRVAITTKNDKAIHNISMTPLKKEYADVNTPLHKAVILKSI